MRYPYAREEFNAISLDVMPTVLRGSRHQHPPEQAFRVRLIEVMQYEVATDMNQTADGMDK